MYQYQSSLYCSSECAGYSYFALTEGNTCVCGDEAPDDSSSTDTCDTVCAGYGDETCGGDSAYDVYSTGNDSSSGASSDTTTATTTSSSSRASAGAGTTSQTETSTSQTTDDQASEATAISTQETSGTTIVLYSTVSADPTTEVVVSETASASSSTTASSQGGSKKNSVIGPAVGGAAGGVVAIVLIILAIFFFKRRQDKSKKEAELADSAYFSALKRDNTFQSTAHASHTRQISNPFITKEEMMVDQRLNPVMINSRRRISEGSLADEADYSRKILTVANPDDD